MTAKDILRSLKKRAVKLRHSNDKAKKIENGGDYFAVIWYKNEAGQMDQCKISDKHLYHLLNERIYTQAIVAVQVYFDPMPFKGCGIFEHLYNGQTVRNVGAHKTNELVERLPSPNFFDVHERIIEQGRYEEFAQSQNISHMVLRPDLAEIKSRNEFIAVTETQHSLIKVTVSKTLKLMEGLIGGKVLAATFVIYFNEKWSPFIVATKNVVVQTAVSTARILMYSGNDHPPVMPVFVPTTTSPASSPNKKGNGRKIVKDFRSLKELSKKGHIKEDDPAHSDSDSNSDHSSDYFSENDDRNKNFASTPTAAFGGRRNTTHNAYAKLTPSDPKFIPPPQPGYPASTTRYDNGECTPEKRIRDRRAGIGVRSTALQKILIDAKQNETKVQFTDTSEPLMKQSGGNNIKPYMMNTEQSNNKMQAYKDDIRGVDSSNVVYRRPISAPHGVTRTASILNKNVIEGKGSSGKAASSMRDLQRQDSLRKKLPLQKDICFGDYCAILTKYKEEWEIDESFIKVKDSHGKDKLKSTIIPHQIPTKSIYLCRSEVAYAGFEIALQANLEGLGHDTTDILTSCAKNHINYVNDKCRKEALGPLLSMAQLRATRTYPNMKGLLIASYVYRNMVSTYSMI